MTAVSPGSTFTRSFPATIGQTCGPLIDPLMLARRHSKVPFFPASSDA
jgi:hypothetical protein